MLTFIRQLDRPVFTTNELAALSDKSLSATTHALDYLEREEVIFKIHRGIWGEVGSERLSAHAVVPFLFPRHRAYVSFISALHIHGIIEQIPQEVTLASTGRSRTIRTTIGTFSVHQITPLFFDGFGWYRKTGSFLIAEPEKALVDSLYLSTRKKKQFAHFPELHFPSGFSSKRAREWAKSIPDSRISSLAQERLRAILQSRKARG